MTVMYYVYENIMIIIIYLFRFWWLALNFCSNDSFKMLSIAKCSFTHSIFPLTSSTFFAENYHFISFRMWFFNFNQFIFKIKKFGKKNCFPKKKFLWNHKLMYYTKWIWPIYWFMAFSVKLESANTIKKPLWFDQYTLFI